MQRLLFCNINVSCALFTAFLFFLIYFQSDSLQYLLEAGWAAEGKVIGVTQPRRVAAISVRALLMSSYCTAPSLFFRVISLQYLVCAEGHMPASDLFLPLFPTDR